QTFPTRRSSDLFVPLDVKGNLLKAEATHIVRARRTQRFHFLERKLHLLLRKRYQLDIVRSKFERYVIAQVFERRFQASYRGNLSPKQRHRTKDTRVHNAPTIKVPSDLSGHRSNPSLSNSVVYVSRNI